MKKTLWLTFGMVAGLSLVAGGASAGALGALGYNITMSDESYSEGSPWYGNREDEEIEPGCVISQEYDLEAVCFDDTLGNLSIVGGYDSNTGGPDPMSAAGDLFIDIDGNGQYGSLGHAGANYNPSKTVLDTFGYDFVVDLDFAAGTYTVIDIRSGVIAVKLDGEQINDASNPWRYVRGGTEVDPLLYSGVIQYADDLVDNDAMIVDYGLTGGSHDVFTLDLNWLADYVEDTNFEFWTHFTMQCGNDNLMGNNPGVPEPATISLLGLGLLGVVMRKKFWA